MCLLFSCVIVTLIPTLTLTPNPPTLTLAPTLTHNLVKSVTSPLPPPFTLRPSPFTLYPAPCTLHPLPSFSLQPSPFSLCPSYALCPSPFALCPFPFTLLPSLSSLHPSPSSTLHRQRRLHAQRLPVVTKSHGFLNPFEAARHKTQV